MCIPGSRLFPVADAKGRKIFFFDLSIPVLLGEMFRTANQTHFFCLIDINFKIRKIICITNEPINQEKMEINSRCGKLRLVYSTW